MKSSVPSVSGHERPALKSACLILTFLCRHQVSQCECGLPTLWVRIRIIRAHRIKSTLNTRLIKQLIHTIDATEQKKKFPQLIKISPFWWNPQECHCVFIRVCLRLTRILYTAQYPVHSRRCLVHRLVYAVKWFRRSVAAKAWV